MKKLENIDKFMNVYGLSEEEAKKLVAYGGDDDLTLEELRIKYENFDLGKKYPDWLTQEQHYNLCLKIARNNFYGITFRDYETAEEFAMDLFIKSSYKLNKINNLEVLYTAIKNIALNLKRSNIRKTYAVKDKEDYTIDDIENKKIGYRINGDGYIATNCILEEDNFTDKIGDYCEDNKNKNYVCIANDNSSEEEINFFEMLEAVKSIKNKTIRSLFIAVFYILGNVEELEEEYNKILIDLTKEQRERLIEVININNDFEEAEKLLDKKERKKTEKKQRISLLEKISEIFNLKDLHKKDFLNLLQQYEIV